jgi:ribosomal protein S18 acetylase RimI-like enzyme
MAGLKLLLDTNVLIALEDPKPLPPAIAALSQKAQLHGLTLFVHEAAVRDVGRDPDVNRRGLTLSKLARFPILEQVAHGSDSALEDHFGSIKNDNDRCDVRMLDCLRLGVVDFLVTEDIGLHKRATRAGLADRTWRVLDALAWIRRTFEPQEFQLPYVLARKAHQISLSDAIFDTLREDYNGFDKWFEEKCLRQHRDCWIVDIGGRIAGLLIRKDETRAEAQTAHAGRRVLKICTFKISPEFRGEKLGEHLLKKVLWFAQANHYDLVYVTAFPKHDFLIALLQTFGFETTRVRENGELMLERPLHHEPVIDLPAVTEPLSRDLQMYPRYYDGPTVGKFVVPIQWQYHITLFPEIAEASPLPLFPEERFVVGADIGADRTPGNTIRKVYVCRAQTRKLKPGSVLVFYLSKCEMNRSQHATSVGVVEQTQLAASLTDLMRAVGRRSVYTRQDLTIMNPREASPVLVIDFLLIGHIAPAVPLSTLLSDGVFSSRPPQSIKSVDEAAYLKLKPRLEISYA